MTHVSVNYLAVLICTIIGMGIGAVWYGPLYGKAWMKAVNLTEEDIKKFNPVKIYGLGFLAHFFIALITAYFISLTNATLIIEGIRVATTAWFGFIASIIFINNLFTGKSFKLFLIDSLYYLVIVIIFSIIIIMWK